MKTTQNQIENISLNANDFPLQNTTRYRMQWLGSGIIEYGYYTQEGVNFLFTTGLVAIAKDIN